MFFVRWWWYTLVPSSPNRSCGCRWGAGHMPHSPPCLVNPRRGTYRRACGENFDLQKFTFKTYGCLRRKGVKVFTAYLTICFTIRVTSTFCFCIQPHGSLCLVVAPFVVRDIAIAVACPGLGVLGQNADKQKLHSFGARLPSLSSWAINLHV